MRAYGILHGNIIIPTNGYVEIPINLVPYPWYTYTPYILFKNRIMQLNVVESISHDAVNMALYSPVSYIFQAFGVGLGEIVSHNTYVMALLGSIVNMTGCTIIIYYAIKYIPYGKGVLLFLSLTPMALQERASLSVDAITFAMAVAMLAFCLYIRCNKVKMNKKHLLLMYLLLFFLASCKVVYFIIGILILFIPLGCFGSKRKGIFHKVAGILLLTVLSVGWFAIASAYLDATRAGGSTVEKVQFIVQNPGRYLYIMDKMIWEEGEELLYQMLGSNLGSLDIVINRVLIILLLLVGVKMFLSEKFMIEKSRLVDRPISFALFFLTVGGVVLIFTSLYIQWTALDASSYEIEGLQGRYFLPIVPLMLCAFLSNRQPYNMENTTLAKSGYVLYIINLITIISILGNYSFM